MTLRIISRFGLFVGLLVAIAATSWAVAAIWGTEPAKDKNTAAVIFTRHDAILALASLGDGSLIAVGKFGRILRSSDERIAWEEIISPTTEDLYSIAFRDDQNGVAVGASGIYLETQDGGHTWSSRDIGATNSELLAVVLEADGRGLITGSFGRVWQTDSGGARWEPITIPWDEVLSDVWNNVGPVEPHLYDVAMVGNVVWVVGEYGLVLISTDGGRNFERHRGGQFTDLHLFAVDLVDSGRGIVAGQAGIIFASSDGGSTWEESSRWGTDLYGISMYDRGTLFAGDLGSVLLLPDDAEADQFQVVASAGRADGVALGDHWIASVHHIGQGRFLALGKGGFQTFFLPPQLVGQSNLKSGN